MVCTFPSEFFSTRWRGPHTLLGTTVPSVNKNVSSIKAPPFFMKGTSPLVTTDGFFAQGFLLAPLRAKPNSLTRMLSSKDHSFDQVAFSPPARAPCQVAIATEDPLFNQRYCWSELVIISAVKDRLVATMSVVKCLFMVSVSFLRCCAVRSLSAASSSTCYRGELSSLSALFPKVIH